MADNSFMPHRSEVPGLKCPDGKGSAICVEFIGFRAMIVDCLEVCVICCAGP